MKIVLEGVKKVVIRWYLLSYGGTGVSFQLSSVCRTIEEE